MIAEGTETAAVVKGGFKLNDINVEIPNGSLCAIVGSVGKGGL